MKRWIFPFVLVVAMTILSGCIVSDSMHVGYEVDTDLTGILTVAVEGIRSNKEDPADQKKEFQAYCEKGYLEQGEELAQLFGVDDPVISLTNVTETSCDLVVESDFGNIAQVLSGLTGEGDFEIKKAKGFLIARLFMEKSDEEEETDQEDEAEDSFTISVRYAGDVQDHNAHQVEQKTGTMTWCESDMDESGIQFVLKIP